MGVVLGRRHHETGSNRSSISVYFHLKERVGGGTVYVQYLEWCKPEASVKETESITENQDQSKCRVVKTTPNRYVYKTTPTSKAEGLLQK